MAIKVVKIGGNVVDSPELLEEFCRDFAALGGEKVLVHGGGKIASDLQRKLGMEPQMIEGRRVTDPETLQIVTMVYAGWCSKHITALLQKYDCNAMGVSGCDASLITATRRSPKLLSDGVTLVDYGLVGNVNALGVNVERVRWMIEGGVVPVFNAINHNRAGDLLNTNADTIASSLAVALGAELVYCFELPGVLLDREDPSSVIPSLDFKEYERLKAEGKVAGGMIPKLDNSFDAIREGAKGVTIKHSSDLLCEGAGTKLKLR